MAITKQITRCDGKARFRSSLLCVSAIAFSIASVGIAVSNALSTVPGSIAGEISENSLSCIQSQYTWVITLSLSGFWLNRTVLWFLLTNLDNLDSAIIAYKQRFDIEEMFRDFKSGGYNLEETNASGQRLISLILLISLAYTSATISGQKIKRMGVQKYVGRIKESGRTVRRHSSFYIGLYGSNWVDFMENSYELVAELMTLAPNKRKYYQQGERAMRLILSAS